MSTDSHSEVPPEAPRALLIAAAPDPIAAAAIAQLRRQHPGFHITAIARAGASLPSDTTIVAPAKGAFGFALRPSLLREARRGYHLAWAVVADLDSSAYRRIAALLRLARADSKSAIGPDGAAITLDQWLSRSHISLSPAAAAGALLRAAAAPLVCARAHRLLRGPRPPWGLKRVNIGISDRCNQRCIICSEHSPYCADAGRRMAADDVLGERDFGLMDANTYHHLIRDLVSFNTQEVELCGLGEPLLHPRLFDFLREAKQAGLWVRLVTNASLLQEDRCRELVALGLDELHVSINAATPEAYAEIHGVAPAVFARVLAAIRAVSTARREGGASRPVIEASFVVQAANYRQPLQWAQTVAEAGADIITFSALGAAPSTAPVQLSPEQFEDAKRNVAAAVECATSHDLHVRGTFGALADAGTSFTADLYTHVPCYIGYIFALVTASGRIHPCCACERVVGNLAEGSFAHAWRGETYRQFREEALDLPNHPPSVAGCSCMACPYGPWNMEFHQRLYAL